MRFTSSRTRGFAPIIILYVVGGLGAAFVGYKAYTWDPLKSLRTSQAEADAKKLADTNAQLNAATTALQTAQAQLKSASDAIVVTTKQQTQVGQTWVAATGRVLQAAPPEIRGEQHVAAAIKSNAQAAQALTDAVGQLTPEQLAIVVQYVADATSAIEAKRAEADSMLQQTQAQLDDMRRQKTGEETAKNTALSQLATATKQYEQVKQANRTALDTFNAALHENGGLSDILETVFFWLKFGVIAYVLLVYVLPLAAHMFPGLQPLADVTHALIAPLAAKAKQEAESLARDASAATHVVLNKIEAKAPDLLKEARADASEWITEADGTKARYDQMLRHANLL